MKTSELIKKLKKIGCYIKVDGTNHDIWYTPKTGKTFLVWRHPSREIPPGTANSILKDAGLK